MATAGELRSQARELLLAYAMTSTARAGAVVSGTAHARPGSAAPTGEHAHPAEAWAGALDAAGDHELKRLVADLRAELDQVRRRALPDSLHADSADDLREFVLERGAGHGVTEVSRALRVTPTFIRRARVAAGCHPETGRLVELNGRPSRIAWAVELIAVGGMSVRQAAAATGVARSTLHDHARRAR